MNKMIANQELIKQIRSQFRLNIYETKVWLALLSKGVATAGEIAEISNVPRSRTYDVLEGLEKQGFAIMKLGKPVKYIAVNPSVVIERLKNNLIKDAEERAQELVKIKGTEDYTQLMLLHKNGIEPIDPFEISGMLKGRSNTYAHLRSLAQKATKDIKLLTTASALSRKKFLKPLFESLKKKGVDVKIAVNGTDEELKALEKDFKPFELRKSAVNSRFCIIDGKEVLFMLNPSNVDEDMDHSVWINSQFFVSSLNSLFESAWKK